MVDIIGFPGQPAPTTRLEIDTAPATIYTKTDYLTISYTNSAAVVEVQKRKFSSSKASAQVPSLVCAFFTVKGCFLNGVIESFVKIGRTSVPRTS